jgi:hypothetical protein
VLVANLSSLLAGLDIRGTHQVKIERFTLADTHPTYSLSTATASYNDIYSLATSPSLSSPIAGPGSQTPIALPFHLSDVSGSKGKEGAVFDAVLIWAKAGGDEYTVHHSLMAYTYAHVRSEIFLNVEHLSSTTAYLK